jgi:hypothetical protein
LGKEGLGDLKKTTKKLELRSTKLEVRNEGRSEKRGKIIDQKI